MGTSPLDLYLEPRKAGKPDQGSSSGQRSAVQRPASAGAPGEVRRTKERVTIHVAPELIQRARAAVYWTPGLTVSDLAEAALEAELKRLEGKRGETFPAIPDGGKVRTGRPVKARG